MKIQVFKIITGEEFISSVEEENDVSYKLKTPMRLVQVSQTEFAMVPLCMIGAEKQNITINKSHVIFTIDPDADIKNKYNGQFGNGIVLPGHEGLKLV